MIPRSDWWMIGVGPRPSLRKPVPTGGAAQTFRATGELFPDWSSRPRRRLTLGLTCSLHGGAARRLLSTFRTAHPDVDLVVEDLDDVSLREELEGRRIDAAIAPERCSRRDWHRTPLWRERLVAVLPERHPLAADNAVAPDALRGEILLLAGDGSGDRALQKAIAEALGGPPASFLHYPVERDTLFDLVALGLGVTVCPGGTLGAFYPGVCLRPIISSTAMIGYDLMWRVDARNDALADFREVAAQLPQPEADHGGR